MKQNKLIILMGISGSGKSTFARDYVSKNSGTRVINQDSIRRELTGNISDQSKNREVIAEAKRRLDECLSNKESVIWDNTSLNLKYLNEIYLKTPEDYTVDIYYTERSFYPMECIASIHEEIENGVDRSKVPDHIVEKQYTRFIDTMKLLCKSVISIPVFR